MTPRAASRLTEEELAQLADKVVEALAGNGLGAKITQIRDTVQRLETQQLVDTKLIAKHETVLFGDENVEGLTGQVRELLRVSAIANRTVGLVIGSVVSFLVGFIIYLISTHPFPP